MLDGVLRFIEDHRQWFDAAQAISSIISLFAWLIAIPTLIVIWRRKSIRSISLGPVEFQFGEAVEATAAAIRSWKGLAPGKTIDIPKIEQTLGPAFNPDIAQKLIGKSILWVDDTPANNTLAVRAFRKLNLEVDQVTTTADALDALAQRNFDVVISDMGRGGNMRAGYELLTEIRRSNASIPYLIFASSDKPEYRREAAALGAQLSTNDMLELIDAVIELLGR